MRRFCVYKRNRQETYYAQIKNPETGKYLPARSTGTSDQSEAFYIPCIANVYPYTIIFYPL